jgi:hypothetical protein
MIDAKSIKQAKACIDDMDDFAKMEIGIDPIGARNFLNGFVDEVSHLRKLLCNALYDLKEHGSEYHHKTKDGLIEQIETALGEK